MEHLAVESIYLAKDKFRGGTMQEIDLSFQVLGSQMRKRRGTEEWQHLSSLKVDDTRSIYIYRCIVSCTQRWRSGQQGGEVACPRNGWRERVRASPLENPRTGRGHEVRGQRHRRHTSSKQ